MAQCKAIRKDGRRCQARARKGSDYCVWHSPERQEHSEADNRIMHITVVNHTPAMRHTDEESYINICLPATSAGVAFEMLPSHRVASLDPRVIFSIVRAGMLGEVLTINTKTFSICIRIEIAD